MRDPRRPAGITRTGTGARLVGAGIVPLVQNARQLLPRPGVRTRFAAGLITLLALVPVLLRLPRVNVVACFDGALPLYQWVPNTSGPACVSAPTPVVSWTLIIAATLLVQLVLLPLLALAVVLLLRASRRLAASAGRVLRAALVTLGELVLPRRQPVPVRVEARYRGVARTQGNPHRGPPSCLH